MIYSKRCGPHPNPFLWDEGLPRLILVADKRFLSFDRGKDLLNEKCFNGPVVADE